MEDAFQVWWFIFWRTLLTSIGITIVLAILVKIIGMQKEIGPLINVIGLIIGIIVQVFYLKSAINRNYKNFRLSAELSNNPTQ